MKGNQINKSNLVDKKVKLGKITLKNPVIAASGTLGYGDEISNFLNPNEFGAICSKSITLTPRNGNPPPRIAETSSGLLNSIGLANIGVEAFIRDKEKFFKNFSSALFVNVAGSTEDEYCQVVERLKDLTWVNGFEVNISCPNVKKGGIQFGKDPESSFSLITKLRGITAKFLMPKLTPNVSDIEEVALAVEEAGADAVSLINTLIGMAVDIELRKPLISTTFGGLSGPAIKPVALAMVYKSASIIKIPVIGIGGIMSGYDAIEFLLAGARAVQIGTVNLVYPDAVRKIKREIVKYCIDHGIESVSEIVGKLEIL